MELLTSHDLKIPLKPSFRFIHEPLGATGEASFHRFVERKTDMEDLIPRILLSDGGAFLIAGYRGVGKTTFVNRVIEQIGVQLPGLEPLVGSSEVIDVYLNLTRPLSSVELMHLILRSLYIRLIEKNILKNLDRKVREDFDLAFRRTSMTVGYKTSDQTERTFGLTDMPLSVPQLGLSSKLTLSQKRNLSATRELSYLTYDDRAAEQDLIRITRLLSQGYVKPVRNTRDLVSLVRRGKLPKRRLKMIFVFDELDKIDAGFSGSEGSAIDQILSNLKSLFTTSGVSFIFVAGKDLYDHWLEDIGKGDSIYESVFTYSKYLPAMWSCVEGLCDPLVDYLRFNTAPDECKTTYGDFKKFLAFKGRGIARRIIRGLNEQVRWDGNTPYIVFSPEDKRRFRFFAGLFDVLNQNEERLLSEIQQPNAIEQVDQFRLGLYYMVDWILQRGMAVFSVEDAVFASHRLSRLVAPTEEIAPPLANELLLLLAEHEYIQEVSDRQTVVQIQKTADNSPKRYQLIRRRLFEMGALSGLFDLEAKSLSDEVSTDIPEERYRSLQMIASGGMSVIYKAVDTRTGRVVLIKQVTASMVGNSDFIERFRRESEILSVLDHRNIARLYEANFSVPRPYIVMQFVDGDTLDFYLRIKFHFEISEIIYIAREILTAVKYIHEKGIIWADPKPSNILVTREGRIVLVDFGISRMMVSDSTQDGEITGTPAYMSPEQLEGKKIDQRSDIYSIGVVLYQMVTTRLPFDNFTFQQRLESLTNRITPPSQFVEIPEGVEQTILKCLNRNPADRFQRIEDVLNALSNDCGSVDISELTKKLGQFREEALFRERYSTDQLPAHSSQPNLEAEPNAIVNVRDDSTTQDPNKEFALAGITSQYGLIMSTETGTIKTFSLDNDSIYIGRSRDCDIVLNDPAVSRYHFGLRRSDQGYVLEDMNTINGVFVNGVRVTSSHLLKSHDEIRAGRNVMTYVCK